MTAAVPLTVPRRGVVWLIPTLLTVHNVEEALAFRYAWPKAQALVTRFFPAFEARITERGFLLALVALSCGAFLLTFLVEVRPRSRRLLWLLLALEATVALNVLSHLAAAVFVFRGYSPGLITALLVNAPFAVYCFTRASRERWLSSSALRATVPAAFVLHGPVLIAALWLMAMVSN